LRTRERRIRAILFDLDLTLVDSSKAIIRSIRYTLDSRGHSYRKEDVVKLVGKAPLEDQFRTLVPSMSDEEIWECVDSFRKFYFTHHLEDATIYPQVVETLQYLKEQGFKLGVVTGGYRETVIVVLNHFHLNSLFDVVVTASEVKSHKPSPDMVFEAARRLRVAASECIVVGDSPSDIEMGKRAGALTAAVSRDGSNRKRLEENEPDLIIENIKELPTALHI